MCACRLGGIASQGSVLAIGTQRGEVQIWDVAHERLIRTMAGHQQRVGNEYIVFG